MLKTISYSYLFNYFGGDTYKDKVISGASILIAIRAYKDNKEVKFKDEIEPTTHGKYFNSVFDVCFDREKLFVIQRNLQVDNLFRLVFGFDEIKAEVIGYELNYIMGTSKECYPDLHLPKEFENLPVSTSMEVSEEEFRTFISNHIDDFDISDNKHAQCPSYAFI